MSADESPPRNEKAAGGEPTATVKQFSEEQIAQAPRKRNRHTETDEHGWPIALALALLDVRDGRLYRARYATFGHYCALRLGITRQRAHQLIGAAFIASEVAQTGFVPKNEAQIRPLKRLQSSEQRCQAWRLAVETHLYPTRRQVETIVQAVLRGLKEPSGGATQ